MLITFQRFTEDAATDHLLAMAEGIPNTWARWPARLIVAPESLWNVA
jgi:hypothetical protein